MTGTATRANVDATSDEMGEVFRRETGTLLGFFIRRGVPAQDAADLVSETFLAAWKNSSGRHRIAPDMLRAWLFGIARKVLSQYRRSRIRRSALADRVRATLAVDASRASASSEALDADLAQHVRELIQRLPATDQEIVRLVYWDGFSQEEVATILGKPATTVRTRLSRARAVLRDQLTESGDLT